MKLHLPKALLTAVLAVCVAQTVQAGWDGDTYYIDIVETPSVSTVGKTPGSSGFFVRTNNQEEFKTSTVTLLELGSGHTLNIDGSWNDASKEFELLTLESVKVSEGVGTLAVSGGNNVSVGNVTGVINVTAQGSIEFTGSSSIGTLGMKDGGVVNFTGGTHTVEKMDIHNNNPSGGSNETLTISGATVKITGSDITDDNGVEDIYGGSTGTAAVTIGHWNNGGGKIVVGGETASASLFDVSGATIRMSWDSGSALEIKENGTVNAKRIQFANDNGDNAVITLAGGRLNLGEGGISANSHNSAYTGTSKREINLNSGTLGALAESVSIAAGTTNIGGAVTIDTAIVNAEGEKTGKTANISFSNNVVLSNAANVTITGGGGVSFNALTLNSNSKLNIHENNTLTLNDDCTFSTSGQVTGAGTMVIGDGANVTVSTSENGKAAIQSAISVSGGGKLIAADGNDRLGWGTTATKSITLAGTSTDKKAIFELGGRQTMATELHMDGYAEVTAYQNQNLTDDNQAGLNAYRKNGAIIDVTGTNNEIAAALHTRGSFHITVAKDGELLVSGQVRAVGDVVTNDCGYDDDKNPNSYQVGSIVKLGEGKITFSNASNVFTKTYFQEAGETVISAKAEFQNGIKITGGEFTLNADITLGSGKKIELAGGTLNVASGSVNSSNINYSSGGLKLSSKNSTLVIDSAAANLVTLATGSGNITVAKDITLTPGTSTQATGNLTVQNAKITLDTTGNHDQIKLKETSMSSFSSVTLDNATLEYVGATTSLNNVTVTSNGANLKFRDMAAMDSEYQFKGTTTLNGNLTVGRMDGDQAWKYTLNIEALTGAGDLSFTSAHETGKLNISSMQGYTGAITVTKGANGAATLNATTGGAVNLKGVTLSNGANGWIKVKNTDSSNTSSLGAVSLSGGSDLRIWNVDGTGTTNISSLTVSDSATLGTYREGSSFQGTVNIASLSSQGESAELTLKNASQTDDATVVNLNGGTFTGTINLEADSSKGDKDNTNRKLHVYLNDTDVAAGAVINFQDPSTETETHKNNNYITLGVGVDGAKVAGLTGTTTKAATIKSSEENTTRSLEIITAADAEYSTNAKVESSVNLVKSGKGKQTITGAVSTTGSVKVNDGELALTGTSTLSLNQLSLFDTTNATGGTLSVGGTNGGTVNIVSAGDKVGSVVVGKGSVLNGNLTLGAGTALTLNGYGDNAATINGTLTLGTGMQVSGLEQLLNDLAAQEAGADGLKSLKLFNVDAVDFGTVEATLAMAADALVEEQPLIAGYDASKYFSTLSVGEYALVFQNSALYIQATAPIPEPTTATLSLLALTALAARRRRK